MASGRYDFYNPYMSAVIVTRDGTRWPLWTGLDRERIGATAFDRAGLNGLTALCFVSEITVAVDLAGVPKITVVLTPPFEEGRKLLDSSVLEWPFSKIEVLLGYVGGSDVIYTGQMTTAPEFQMGTDISITLTGVGEGGFNAAVSTEPAPLPRQTRRDAMKALLGGGVRGVISTLDDSAVALTSEAFDLLEEEVIISPAGYSSWALLTSLARQCRCWALFLDTTLTLIPYQVQLTGPARRNFYFRDYPGGKLGIEAKAFPILSVSSDTAATLFFTGVTQGLFQGDIQSATAAVSKRYITDKTAAPSKPGEGSSSPLSLNDVISVDPETGVISGQGLLQAPGSPDDAFAAGEAISDFDHKSARGLGIELTIETLGVPDLFPGDVIAVYGVGRRFDSTRTGRLGTNYAILALTHKIGDGFTTTLKCQSATVPFADQDATVQAASNGAVAKAPAEDGSAEIFSLLTTPEKNTIESDGDEAIFTLLDPKAAAKDAAAKAKKAAAAAKAEAAATAKLFKKIKGGSPVGF